MIIAGEIKEYIEDDCEDCENERRRADQWYDQYDNLAKEMNDLEDKYDSKCDEYREAMNLIGELRLKLAEHNIEHNL